MTKTRIKVETTVNHTRYTPQYYRGWFLGWVNYTSKNIYTSFLTEKDARKFLAKQKNTDIIGTTYITVDK